MRSIKQRRKITNLSSSFSISCLRYTSSYKDEVYSYSILDSLAATAHIEYFTCRTPFVIHFTYLVNVPRVESVLYKNFYSIEYIYLKEIYKLFIGLFGITLYIIL